MRILLCLLLCSCATPAITPPNPVTPIPLLTPVAAKSGPKSHGFDSGNRAMEWSDRRFRFYHGQMKVKDFDADQQRMYGFGPVIEIRQGRELRLLDLRDQHPAHCFGPIFHDQRNQRVLALLQHCVAGPAATYQVWITEDGGDHWFRGADLERPSPRFPYSDLYTIFMDGNGRGEAWFRTAADHYVTDENELKQGSELIYRSTTADGGRSWQVGRKPALKNGLEETGKP